VSTQYAIAVVIIYLLVLCTAALAVVSVLAAMVSVWVLSRRMLPWIRRRPSAGRAQRASGAASRQYRQGITGID
jgi:uncharacterized protein HemY